MSRSFLLIEDESIDVPPREKRRSSKNLPKYNSLILFHVNFGSSDVTCQTKPPICTGFMSLDEVLGKDLSEK